MSAVSPFRSAGDSAFERIFYDAVEDISGVERTEEGHDALKQAAAQYGLEHAVYLGLNIPGLTQGEPYLAVTYSDEWCLHYRQQGYVDIDPVVRLGLTGLLPVDWRSFDRSSPRVRRLFGEAADAKIGNQGLTFPVRGALGELALFSITANASDSQWTDRKRLYMRDFQVIAHHVHTMVLRMTGATQTDYADVLSERERECLQWAAVGKSAWDTSVILSISERSVKFYLDQARHKLDCMNKTHAVAKAISLGLVRPPC
jgi:DNA-binding CsgD family transcriptional regulator